MMHFGRKEGLPMAVHSGARDGSGRGIHMDSPVHRAWREASTFMKASYLMLVVSLLITYGGYRHLRYSHASLSLACRSLDCILDVNPASYRRKLSISFARKQLLLTQPIRVDNQGNFIKVDSTPAFDPGVIDKRRQRKNKKSKNKKGKSAATYQSTRGPDENGHYLSYQIVLQQPSGAGHYDEEGEDDDDDDKKETDLTALLGAGINARWTEEGHIAVHMRPFNLLESRKRPRTIVSRLESYIKQRRHKLTVKETKGLSWQGILSIVFGLFAFLLTILIGQFREEKSHHSGPGVRRQQKKPLPKKRVSNPMTTAKTGYNPSYPVPKARSNSYQRSTAAAPAPSYGSSATASTTVRRKGY